MIEMKRHHWTKDEDKIVFFSYRFKNTQQQNEIANKLLKENGISIASFNMRILNYLYLDSNGKEGLANYSKQSKEIYDKYKTATQEEFKLNL